VGRVRENNLFTAGEVGEVTPILSRCVTRAHSAHYEEPCVGRLKQMPGLTHGGFYKQFGSKEEAMDHRA
jgi:hypothetical protein